MAGPYLIDTDILIDLGRKTPGAERYLEALGGWSYSVVTEMELVAGARNREEVAAVAHVLFPYRKLPLTEEAGELASNLMKEYSRASGMDPLDALIAASALTEGLTLATRNRKHFSGIPGLDIEVPGYGASG